MDLSKYDLKIFSQGKVDFDLLALEVFRFQYASNPVYRDYVNALSINVAAIESIAQIPFLPIRFFKSHKVQTTVFEPEIIFESSGTTGSINSRHFIKELSLYKRSFSTAFELFHGPVKDYCIIGLLPSYLERKGSSLVYMVNELIGMSNHPQSGFYLYEFEKLSAKLMELEKAGQKTILIGVTFALLDFAERCSFPLQHTTIIETGGMKGRREEMIRVEVHDRLKAAFQLPYIHSEYGMTELLSQAYSEGDGVFYCPPWMKMLIRDDEDPLSIVNGEWSIVNDRLHDGMLNPENSLTIHHSRFTISGAVNIIDLANIYSCSFIATDDAGRLHHDGSFEVLGRIDNSDIRGCSLMYDV